MTKIAYKMKLTNRGKALVNAWKKGDLKNLQNAFAESEEAAENKS